MVCQLAISFILVNGRVTIILYKGVTSAMLPGVAAKYLTIYNAGTYTKIFLKVFYYDIFILKIIEHHLNPQHAVFDVTGLVSLNLLNLQ